MDEASSNKGNWIEVYVQSSVGELIRQSLRLRFAAYNNEVDYEAIINYG